MNWTIKQIAEMTGISTDTLRFYERQGIVSPKRSANGYRYYDEDELTILKYIVVMKYAHFTLAEIKSMVELFGREPNAKCCKISRGILNAKISELELVMGNYQKIVSLMEDLMPMVCSVNAFRSNEKQINEFICQIFNDLQGNSSFSISMLNDKLEKECE